MKNNKHAVSLIVLVVTILVLAILASVVIISLNNANIMGEASKTVFKSDMANYKEAYELYVTKKTIRDITFNRDSLNVTNADNPTEFKEIFGDKVPDKYKDGLKVVNGKLVYETEDETEKAVLEELIIASSATEVTPSTPTVPDTPSTPTNAISKTETTSDGKSPYIGYYVDKNGDGTVDGVIFADLAIGGSGTWGGNTYSYTAVSDKSTLKDYVVSSTEHTDAKFGTHPVLEVAGSTENKVDRFYVMALSDVTNTGTTNNSFTWYREATVNGISDYSTVTLVDFGSGKTNTSTMITKWNDTEYGAKNTADIWGVVEDGWFVPSKNEWGVFASTFGVTTSNYSSTYGLSDYYWSSSLSGTTAAKTIHFIGGGWSDYTTVDVRYPVRLATTF